MPLYALALVSPTGLRTYVTLIGDPVTGDPTEFFSTADVRQARKFTCPADAALAFEAVLGRHPDFDCGTGVHCGAGLEVRIDRVSEGKEFTDEGSRTAGNGFHPGGE